MYNNFYWEFRNQNDHFPLAEPQKFDRSLNEIDSVINNTLEVLGDVEEKVDEIEETAKDVKEIKKKIKNKPRVIESANSKRERIKKRFKINILSNLSHNFKLIIQLYLFLKPKLIKVHLGFLR